jgi:RNA-binding protein 5/10
LLEAFSQYGQVKDIRLICDKISGEPKDFAFVEYFTIEEATIALGQIKRNPVKIRNNPLYVTFSKIRRPEDLKVTNFN